jgi:hypothetical protein
MVNGVLKSRPGRILGPLLMAAFLVFYAHTTVALDLAAAEAADTRMVQFNGPRPKMVAIEKQTTFCVSHCRQILANTDFDVMQRPRVSEGAPERPWQRFHKVVGSGCDDDKHRNSTIGFIRLGYVGICSEEVDHDAKVDEAIIISTDRGSADWERAESFRGEVAVVEILRNGTRTVIGRWIDGRIEAPFQLLLGPLAAKGQKVGSKFTSEEVYRAAIGIVVSDAERRGPEPIKALIAEYERLGDSRRPRYSISDDYTSMFRDLNDPHGQPSTWSRCSIRTISRRESLPTLA